MPLAIFDVSGTLQEDSLGAPIYDEFYDIFKKLKSQNIQIALATNLSRSGLDYFIKNNHIKEFIDEDICLSEAAPKPNIEMLEQLLLRTGEDVKSSLMIGDGLGDILMAQSLGMKCCAVNWSHNWSSSVLQLNPDYKVEKIANLWQVFEKVFDVYK